MAERYFCKYCGKKDNTIAGLTLSTCFRGSNKGNYCEPSIDGGVPLVKKVNNRQEENVSQKETNWRKMDVSNIRVPKYLIPLIIAAVICHKLFQLFENTFGIYFFNLSFISFVLSLIVLPIGVIIIIKKINIRSLFIKIVLPITISLPVFVFFTMFKYKYITIIPILLLWIGYLIYIAHKKWDLRNIILTFFLFMKKKYQDGLNKKNNKKPKKSKVDNVRNKSDKNTMDIIFENNDWICGNCNHANDNKTMICKKCKKRFGINGYEWVHK